LGAYRIPLETGLFIPSDKRGGLNEKVLRGIGEVPDLDGTPQVTTVDCHFCQVFAITSKATIRSREGRRMPT
jgi:hypothetical protein